MVAEVAAMSRKTFYSGVLCTGMEEVDERKTLKVVSSENNELAEGSILEVIDIQENQFNGWKTYKTVIVTGSIEHKSDDLPVQLRQGPNDPENRLSVPSACKSWTDTVYVKEV